jgi:hypothetical protein
MKRNRRSPYLNSAEWVDEALRARRTIYAPDGTRFSLFVRVNEDAASIDQLFRPDFVRYEVIGPDNEIHVWIFDHLLEVVPDPDHDDVPRLWSFKAEIALSGWNQLTEEATP